MASIRDSGQRGGLVGVLDRDVLLLAHPTKGSGSGLLREEGLSTAHTPGHPPSRGLLEPLGLQLALNARLLGQEPLLDPAPLALREPELPRAPTLLEVIELPLLALVEHHLLASAGGSDALGDASSGLRDARADQHHCDGVHSLTL
jgi:hypothetical protein